LVGQLLLLMQMSEPDQELDLEELCELVAGLELIHSCSEEGRGNDMASNDALMAVGAIAVDLIAMVRSLDDTCVLNLEKIQSELKKNTGA